MAVQEICVVSVESLHGVVFFAYSGALCTPRVVGALIGYTSKYPVSLLKVGHVMQLYACFPNPFIIRSRRAKMCPGVDFCVKWRSKIFFSVLFSRNHSAVRVVVLFGLNVFFCPVELLKCRATGGGGVWCICDGVGFRTSARRRFDWIARANAFEVKFRVIRWAHHVMPHTYQVPLPWDRSFIERGRARCRYGSVRERRGSFSGII